MAQARGNSERRATRKENPLRVMGSGSLLTWKPPIGNRRHILINLARLCKLTDGGLKGRRCQISRMWLTSCTREGNFVYQKSLKRVPEGSSRSCVIWVWMLKWTHLRTLPRAHDAESSCRSSPLYSEALIRHRFSHDCRASSSIYRRRVWFIWKAPQMSAAITAQKIWWKSRD